MAKKEPRLDGFVPRANRQNIGTFKQPKPKSAKPTLDGISNQSGIVGDQSLNKAEADFEITFDDLDETEREEITKKKRWYHRKKKEKKPRNRIVTIFKRTAFASMLVLVGIGGFIGVKGYLAAQSVIDRNGNCPVALCGNDGATLTGEGDGRVNILLIGIGGDAHTAGDLADTIIVASIDPIAKEAAMLSIPRDLYLSIPGYGSDRVNAAHSYGEQYGFEEANYPEGGVGLLQKTVEENFDIPIHYYLRVDFTAFQQAVDSVGGVDVKLEDALYDPTFWWEFGVLDLDPGMHTLDGQTALMYVRSRKTSARGDFDRNERQREVIVSLKDKALSVGTFSDPRKIIGLIDTVGSNVRTNIQVSEMVRLYELGEEITEDKIVSTGLADDGTNFLSNANIGGASVLVPRSGDFNEIQAFVRSIFVDGFIRSENAAIAVYNGSTIPGAASATDAELSSFNYNVAYVEIAPTTDYQTTQIFDVSDGSKPFTKALLEQRYGVEMRSESFLPEGLYTEGMDFVIIIGADYEAE